MSTRAVYTFKDSDNTFHVYKHYDGYPMGAVQWIKNALPFAWALPRFEASEFAAAFISANKEQISGPKQGGDVYLSHGPEDHGDLDFRYEITFNGKDLIVKAFDLIEDEKLIFEGTLNEFSNLKESL